MFNSFTARILIAAGIMLPFSMLADIPAPAAEVPVAIPTLAAEVPPPVPTGLCCLGPGPDGCKDEWTELECKIAGGIWKRNKECEPTNVNACGMPGVYD